MKTKDTLELWDILMQIGQAPPLIENPLMGIVYLSEITLSPRKTTSKML